jgi:Ca2+-dependent lipid-binding protein
LTLFACLSDDKLGEGVINLHRLDMSAEYEDDSPRPVHVVHNGKAAGTVWVMLSRRMVPKGAFAGQLHCTIVRICDFPNTCGVLARRVDPYCKLSLGSESKSTPWLSNAGGADVVFEEVMTFDKQLMDTALRVQVYHKGTVSDDLLGEVTVNLHRMEMPQNYESTGPVPFQMTCKGKPSGLVYMMFSRRPVPKGAFAGLLHVHVWKIDDVADTAGLLDRTDPYVQVQCGVDCQKTGYKSNAGGHNVIFDEVLTLNKAMLESRLVVSVYDKDTLSDDKLGEAVVNLHRLDLPVDYEEDEPVQYQLFHNSNKAGVVFMKLSRRIDNVPQGAFAGIFHVTIERIDQFSDTAGFMDRTDPYVEVQLGRESFRTSVKDNAGGHDVIFQETLTFQKALLQGELKVIVKDKDTLSDDTLGDVTIDLNALALPEDYEDSEAVCYEARSKGIKAGEVFLKLSRKAIPAGAFAGVFHVTIERIDQFSDTAGFMDRTDPYVEVQLGRESFRTSVKDNAGGHDVIFQETLTFQKALLQGELKVIVKDKDTLSDDTLGDVTIDLNALALPEDYEDSEAVCYEARSKGIKAGEVFLKLSRKAIPAGAFAGVFHVTIERIDQFSDTAGFMDRTDPYVEVQLGRESFRTSVKDNAGGHDVIFQETLTFQKALLQGELKVIVKDKDTLSDDTLGDVTIDLNALALPEDYEDSEAVCYEARSKGIKAGEVFLKLSRKAIPAGAFAGVFHVTIERIDQFSDTAGFMDRTDPYVEVQLGRESFRTSVKDNAGGHDVIFQETLTFQKALLQGELKVIVKDKDTLSDDTLGDVTIDLNALALPEDYEDSEAVCYEARSKGIKAGEVFLKLSRKAIPAGAFAGVFHVTIERIDQFSDTAGFMDRTDPYVEVQLGRESFRTSVKDNAGGHDVIFQETLTFQKALLQGELKVIVKDKDTLSDDTLGDVTIDLNALALPEDYEDSEAVCYEARSKGIKAGEVFLKLSRKAIPAGAFAGVFHVTIERIDQFSDTAGFMDRTDPYVEVQLGRESFRTSVKDNAGGHDVIFQETLTFQKALLQGELKVIVKDKDTLSDDTLGDVTIDLNALALPEDYEDSEAVCYEARSKGIKAGEVFLKLSRKAIPAGAWAGPLLVTVEKIDEFSDNAGFMDRADPYVLLSLDDDKMKTSVKDNAGGKNVFFNEFLFFNKNLLSRELRVSVMDKDTISDDAMGEATIDLHALQMVEDHEDDQSRPFETKIKGKVAGRVFLKFSRKSVPVRAWAGLFHVVVHSIDGFKDKTSILSKSDPFVTLALGGETFSTTVKKSAGVCLSVCLCACVCVCVCARVCVLLVCVYKRIARRRSLKKFSFHHLVHTYTYMCVCVCVCLGGTNVVFREIFSFNKQLLQNNLSVKVYDKEMVRSNELFGECQIDLHAPDMVEEDDERKDPQEFQTYLNGKKIGRVLLCFSRKATPPLPDM